MVRAQERTLRNLRGMGFGSVSSFALPWGPGGLASCADPDRWWNLWAALDRILDVSEKHGIGLAWSLAAAMVTDPWLTDPGGESMARSTGAR
ncbi:MAG TPA: hypothetical protein VLH79_15525 [Chthonomonadales bacterium]|nr:hypothetical protein [Chthonomonadales bacterium]